jgi:predicted membrane chloride channel (bestrophin family)
MQDFDMTEQLPAKKPKKERPIPRGITQAVDGLCNGEYKSITAAAKALEYTREHLSKALRTPRVQVLIETRTREILSASRMPAAAVLLRLLEFAQSERVKADIAIHLLGINNHRVPANSAPIVNVGLSVGYVIDLSGSRDDSPMITVTPGEAA